MCVSLLNSDESIMYGLLDYTNVIKSHLQKNYFKAYLL